MPTTHQHTRKTNECHSKVLGKEITHPPCTISTQQTSTKGACVPDLPELVFFLLVGQDNFNADATEIPQGNNYLGKQN